MNGRLAESHRMTIPEPPPWWFELHSRRRRLVEAARNRERASGRSAAEWLEERECMILAQTDAGSRRGAADD